MNPNFSDGAPRTIKEWHDMGYMMIPCNTEGVPIIKGWANDDYDSKVSTIQKEYQLRKNIPGVFGVRLEDIVDFDIDNYVMQKFIAGRIVCGAKFGRKSNPLSHLLFQGSTENTFYVIAVYFGSVGIKNTRYAVLAGLFADVVGIIAAIILAYVFWG